MPDFIEEFLSSLRLNGGSPHTIRAYRADLAGPLKNLQSLPERQVVEILVKNHLNEGRKTWAPKTTRRKVSAFRSWGAWMGWDGFLASYRTPTPAKAKPHPIPEGIIAVELMAELAPNEDIKALVILQGLCGLRVGEAIKIRVEHFDLHDKVIEFEGKNATTRIVPISPKAWEYLRIPFADAVAREDTRLVRYQDRTARDWITRLAVKAGVSRPVASHDLRATFGTAAYKKTQNLRAVQELLGHSSSRTTEVYTFIGMDEMRDAADVA